MKRWPKPITHLGTKLGQDPPLSVNIPTYYYVMARQTKHFNIAMGTLLIIAPIDIMITYIQFHALFIYLLPVDVLAVNAKAIHVIGAL